MKPSELYAMKPEREDNKISVLAGFGYNHLEEIRTQSYQVLEDELFGIKTKDIVIKYIKDFCFDGRRVWVLATVWYLGSPVMIIQNAGREGDDHAIRFITDAKRFKKMCIHIEELITEQDKRRPLFVRQIDDSDRCDLDEFYGHALSEEFLIR